jgi:hypothetical protein
MKITRLYTGSDHQSHFEEIDIPMQENPFGKNTEAFAAQALMFGEVEIPEVSWHCPPFRQCVVMLQGAMEIEVGSGDKKFFREGEILFAEDTTGQGHITRAASKGIRRYLVVPLG